jgi:hypothetical protein
LPSLQDPILISFVVVVILGVGEVEVKVAHQQRFHGLLVKMRWRHDGSPCLYIGL